MPTLPFDSNRAHHKKLNPPEETQLEILRSAHWGSLATVSADGEPYTVPIGFAYDEASGHLIFHTAPRGVKIDNLRRDNRVCFSIVGAADLVAGKFSATFQSVLVFGRMERICDEEQFYQAALVFCRKFAPGTTAELLQTETDEGTDMALLMQKAADHMAMFRLIPYHISSKQRVR